MIFKTLLLCAVCAYAYSQNYGPTTTPVPILKQINRQNDDGSYSYGYEGADGSFKIETKYANGDVAGKYGYVDESGKVREVSYGASSQRGFEPEGNGIMVPPPTLHDPSSKNALPDGQEDDGQYREDPRIYEDSKYNGRAQTRPNSFRQYQESEEPRARYQPQPKVQSFQAKPQQQSFQSSFSQPQYQEQYQPQPQQQYQPQPQQQYQPQQQQYQQQYQPQPQTQPQPQYQQQSSFFKQSPQQFPQEYKPQSQVFHQQPQFSYQSYTPQPYQSQNYQSQYQNQNYNPFNGHPAQNFDPSTGSYSINFTGK